MGFQESSPRVKVLECLVMK